MINYTRPFPAFSYCKRRKAGRGLGTRVDTIPASYKTVQTKWAENRCQYMNCDCVESPNQTVTTTPHDDIVYIRPMDRKWREGYHLPTWAWKVTCRHFDWMLQSSQIMTTLVLIGLTTRHSTTYTVYIVHRVTDTGTGNAPLNVTSIWWLHTYTHPPTHTLFEMSVVVWA